ncbi:MAG: hypothetical protein OXC26_06360 [Albidovulum sp.]|nr:hypothetical protein [Albidovulum sp.]
MSNDEMTLWRRDGLVLPIRTSPIRFAVDRGNGLTSDAWGVSVEKNGDAYIYCRGGLRGQKVSLHSSGKQHISFNEDDPSMRNYKGDRFMNQWQEPEYEGKAIPTCRLLFPRWGLQLAPEQRKRKQARWDKNQVLIPGHAKMVTVVSFVIVDDGMRLRKEEGSLPSAPFGVLRLRPGKTLCAIAGYEPERNLREKVDDALREMAREIEATNDPNELGGKVLETCLTGYTLENCVFMLPLWARYTAKA